eukprot:m.238073 g.238073  ORF g.238073 m.238073 type:complete len:129 (-) comp18964_c3_seq3:549-935(-)
MGKHYGHINKAHRALIAKQHMFWVATAALSKDHHVNVSPKAHARGCFSVVDDLTVAYLDLTGSGSETVAHLRENGRITILFNNIEEGAPAIVRLHGKGSVVLPSEVGKEANVHWGCFRFVSVVLSEST